MIDIDLARATLAHRTRRGIGMPVAGLLFWLGFAALGATQPPKTASLLAFFATGLVFPLGWWFTRLAGGDLMAKVAPLTSLGMIANFTQLLFWPVLIAVFLLRPEWVPFTMGALFGSHFLPYAWIYRSRGYAVLGVGCPVAATVAQLAAPQLAMVGVPLAVASVYALAVVLLAGENRAQAQAGPALA